MDPTKDKMEETLNTGTTEPVSEASPAQEKDGGSCPPAEKKDKKKKDGAPAKADPKDAEIDGLKAEIDALTDKLLRTAAEFDNYRKRTEREKTASISYGCCATVERLLPVLDTLERAAEVESTDAEYKKGVVMTLDGFRKALDALGIEEISALGQPFDPELHNAVSRIADPDAESGTVVAVMQKGYRMADRVIRHAMVVVAE